MTESYYIKLTDRHRLTSLASTTPATTQDYTYDAMDRLTAHTLRSTSGPELAKITYGWDKDDHVVSKTIAGTAGAGGSTYEYVRVGRLTSWTAPGGATTTYTWDAAGNRIQAGDKNYAYDERNRLLSGGGTTYTYSPRGTLTTETTGNVTRSLVFDAFDRLASDGDAAYGYDALGRLTSRTKGGTEQRFVYSGLTNDMVTVTDGAGAAQSKYGRDPFGDLLSIQEAGQSLGTMTDMHGDLVGTFSGTALVDSVAYNPFGVVINRTGAVRSLGYQGEYTDPDIGKVNMDARWYQPGAGGFSSRDDWSLSPDPSIQINRYAYANGDPITGRDPSGHGLDKGSGPSRARQPNSKRPTRSASSARSARTPRSRNAPETPPTKTAATRRRRVPSTTSTTSRTFPTSAKPRPAATASPP